MCSVLKKTEFNNPQELRSVFSSADNFKYKVKWWVLDVGVGVNDLRIFTFIQFVNKRTYIKNIVNHTDYDKLSEKYKSNN